MGWNSWNCWACGVTDENIRASARAMVEKGLINHGWTYINIDDCWMIKPDSDDPVISGEPRNKNGMPLTNKKFPDMKDLTDYIHGLGLKAGIYTSPGPYTCQGFTGSYEYEAQDAKQFANWGFDYLKYDWCYYSRIAKDKSLNELKRPYLRMRDELLKQPRDIIYSLCQYGMGEVWKWGEEVGGNCWRTTGDIVDTWSSMSKIGFSQNKCSKYAKPGCWNDPDMLVVGNVGWGPELHPSNLTPDEQYTHISLWCLLSAPLLIGCPIEQIDDFTLNLLTNDEVLEVNQDPLGKQAEQIIKNEDYQVWAKKMEDGSLTVGLFNMDSYKHKAIVIEWSKLGLKGKQRIRDLWRQKDLGIFQERFESNVSPHGVTLVRVIPE
jgi:alpha-galactosidase